MTAATLDTRATRMPDETRANILAVATREFADKGLAGARIDEIAEQTRTSKRMIYYYFDSKEGLYRAVLEAAYAHIRLSEPAPDLAARSAIEALRDNVGATFDYHWQHPEFVRLVMNENIHHGAHIGHVEGIKERNRSVITALRAILDQGAGEGSLRADIDPVDLHMSISALCFYNVSNRYTFSQVFEHDMSSPQAVAARREQVIAMIIASVVL
ncbi:TetR/AcrR family transcriptional regulator [Sphingomonas sp. PB4P5]|uniref:TetR/AcrR family transcriptional regulator n=1 Tax=Parasphingomonas puruogangriensis TaxID=3096155 RepID=UPI002FC6FA04